MPLPRTPAFVRADDDAWTVVDRESNEAVSEHATPGAALNALLMLPGFERKAAILHDPDTKKPNGVWRWLDGSAEQPKPGHEGAQVTADAIATMAARLNEGEPVMVDGGSKDSLAHDAAVDPATYANGWAHVGAELFDANGRCHLMLYAELLPSIAREVDSGRLAKGSIHFVQVREDRADSTLRTHALLNRPAVSGLMPSTALLAETNDRTVAAYGPLETLLMPTKNPKALDAKRGPATDKLNELLALLKIAPSDDENYDPWGKVMQAVTALQGAAKVEEITEGGAPPPVAQGQRAEGDPPPAASPDVDKALLSDLIAALGSIFGEGTPAELLTKLQAQIEAFKGALGTAGGTNPNPQNEGQMSESSKEVRTELAAVRTDLTSVRAELSEIKAERDALKAEKRKVDATAKVDARAIAAKRSLAPEDREWCVEMVLSAKDDKAADELLRRVIGPATGEAMPSTLAGSRATTDAANAGDDGDPKAVAAKRQEAIDTEIEAVRKERPEITKKGAARIALQRLSQKNPGLFGGGADPNTEN